MTTVDDCDVSLAILAIKDALAGASGSGVVFGTASFSSDPKYYMLVVQYFSLKGTQVLTVPWMHLLPKSRLRTQEVGKALKSL